MSQEDLPFSHEESNRDRGLGGHCVTLVPRLVLDRLGWLRADEAAGSGAPDRPDRQRACFFGDVAAQEAPPARGRAWRALRGHPQPHRRAAGALRLEEPFVLQLVEHESDGRVADSG